MSIMPVTNLIGIVDRNRVGSDGPTRQSRYSVIFSAEEHNVTGGFGSALAEVLADAGMGRRPVRIGMPDQYAILGPPNHLYRHYGLDGAGVAQRAREALG